MRKILFLSLFFVGCAHAPDLHSPETIASLERVEKNTEKRNEASGEGMLTWTGKGRHLTAPGVLLVAWPDKLRLELQDPIGGRLALLVIQGEKFWWDASDRPEIYTGAVSRLSHTLGLPFTAEDLVRAFLARPGVERWKGGAPAQEELEWSSRWNEPLLWRKSFGEKEISVVFAGYDSHFGVQYAKETQLHGSGPAEGESSLTWVWRDWEPRLPGAKNLFQIPAEGASSRPIKALP